MACGLAQLRSGSNTFREMAMRIKCDRVVDGLIPSESIVCITTHDGSEEVVVHSGLVQDMFLFVGNVLGRDAGKALVELPRESASGKWRVWVPEAALAT